MDSNLNDWLEWMKREVNESGIPKGQIAKKAAISGGYLSMLLSGRKTKPSPRVRQTLSRALHQLKISISIEPVVLGDESLQFSREISTPLASDDWFNRLGPLVILVRDWGAEKARLAMEIAIDVERVTSAVGFGGKKL